MRASLRSLVPILTLMLSSQAACGDDSSEGTGGSTGETTASTGTSSTGETTGTGGGGGGGGEGRIAGDLLFGSGDRLRARVWDGGDGALGFAGFVDTELDVTCTFYDFGDGDYRCAPSSQVLFTDDGCSMPIVAAADSCGSPGYGVVFEPPAEGCALGRARAYRATDEVAQGETAFYFDGVSCVDLVIPDFSGLRVAEEVSPDTFVLATVVSEPLDDRLARTLLVAEDGAVSVIGAIDRERDSACSAPPRFDEGAICDPTDVAGASETTFADPECSERAAITDACSADPSLIVEYTSEGCFGTRRYFERGEALVTVYGDDAGTCDVLDVEGGFRLGAAVEAATFPPVEQMAIGTGALRVEGVGASGAWLATTGYYVDASRGTECYPRATIDGDRCMPVSWATGGDLYADTACTIPVALGFEATECNPGTTIALRATAVDDACNPSAFDAAWELGAVHTGEIFADVEGECLPAGGGGTAFLLGDEIPLSDFPAMTLRVE